MSWTRLKQTFRSGLGDTRPSAYLKTAGTLRKWLVSCCVHGCCTAGDAGLLPIGAGMAEIVTGAAGAAWTRSPMKLCQAIIKCMSTLLWMGLGRLGPVLLYHAQSSRPRIPQRQPRSQTRTSETCS